MRLADNQVEIGITALGNAPTIIAKAQAAILIEDNLRLLANAFKDLHGELVGKISEGQST